MCSITFWQSTSSSRPARRHRFLSAALDVGARAHGPGRARAPSGPGAAWCSACSSGPRRAFGISATQRSAWPIKVDHRDRPRSRHPEPPGHEAVGTALPDRGDLTAPRPARWRPSLSGRNPPPVPRLAAHDHERADRPWDAARARCPGGRCDPRRGRAAGHKVHGLAEAQVLLGRDQVHPQESFARHLGRTVARTVVHNPKVDHAALVLGLERTEAAV